MNFVMPKNVLVNVHHLVDVIIIFVIVIIILYHLVIAVRLLSIINKLQHVIVVVKIFVSILVNNREKIILFASLYANQLARIHVLRR
uniref:Uncharacterized protein n=1 Tax=Acrobeloides nanus TaxID=290746 RepID=A0A914BV78_9BILA